MHSYICFPTAFILKGFTGSAVYTLGPACLVLTLCVSRWQAHAPSGDPGAERLKRSARQQRTPIGSEAEVEDGRRGATDKQTGRRQTRKQHPRWETLAELSVLSRRSACLNVTRFAVEPPYGRQISPTVTTVSAYVSHTLSCWQSIMDGSCRNNTIWLRVSTSVMVQSVHTPFPSTSATLQTRCQHPSVLQHGGLFVFHAALQTSSTPVCTFPRWCPGACVDIAVQQQWARRPVPTLWCWKW